jgi:hypothetical protein
MSPFRCVLRAQRRLADGSAVLDKFGFLRTAPQPPFRSGESTRCTCCGSSQWLVGRQSAQCAVCAAPAALATPVTTTQLTAKLKG